MTHKYNLQNKILNISDGIQKVEAWKKEGKTIVFTNGCFDILHPGHIASLNEAADHGDILIVGLNADSSVRSLKGPERPINNELSRAIILSSLVMVDAVIIFNEPTPRELILALKPDVLVKGGDYKVEDIAGAKEVIAGGGKVIINPILEGYSTTSIINKLQKDAGPGN